MCRQFLVLPFQLLVHQNWKNWPGNYMGRLWILPMLSRLGSNLTRCLRLSDVVPEQPAGDYET